jgi:hypothetical protein
METMLKPPKIKIFMETGASAIEDKINGWLASQEQITIIKTETVVTAAAEKSNNPWIVITVWYELPPSERDRPGFRIA